MTEIFGSWLRRRFIYLPVNLFYSFFHPVRPLCFWRENPRPYTQQERCGLAVPCSRALCRSVPGSRFCVAALPRRAGGRALPRPERRCHQRPSSAIWRGSNTTSPHSRARHGPATAEPPTGLAPRPQGPRPRLGRSRGTSMWPGPAFHPRGAKPAVGRGTEMNLFAFLSCGWV